jgi:hypothetical protein
MERYPGAAEAIVAYARIASGAGRADEAKAALGKFTEKDPRCHEARSLLVELQGSEE